MPPPYITVIIPTRNREALLRRALASVYSQTHTAWEIIIIDDGSIRPINYPGTAGHEPVHLLRHAARRGASSARNTGLAAARGDLVAFLDDDDQWHPEKLAIQVRALEAAGPDAVLTYCGYLLTVTRTQTVLESYTPDLVPLTPSDFLYRTFFGCSMPLIRTSVLRSIGGFDPRLPGMQDRDLWLRLVSLGSFVPVPRILVTCHVHGPSISTNIETKIRAKQDFWTKHATTLAAEPQACARHWHRLAMLHFANGDSHYGRICLARAHKWSPQGPKRMLHMGWSLLSPSSHARHVTRCRFRGSRNLRWYT